MSLTKFYSVVGSVVTTAVLCYPCVDLTPSINFADTDVQAIAPDTLRFDQMYHLKQEDTVT